MATVLIVDDRAINREFLATLLRYVGHRVLEAADGAQALEVTRAQQPDLVITDVLMPTMDGIEFATRLHADPLIANIPIIFYTATYRLSEARELARACGVTTVLAKPSEPQAILDAVAATLGIDSAAAPATEGAGHASPLAGKLPSFLRELAELQHRLQRALDQGLELIGERDTLQQASERLFHAFGTVQALSLRLAALLELDLVLASEREPQRLLDLFCRAAQDIMDSKYAVVGILDSRGARLQHWATRGLTEEAQAALPFIDPRGGIFGEVLTDNKVCRLDNLTGSPAVLGLPDSHPAVSALLAVPVRSATSVCGWLYLADKLGGTRFGDEDEQFAVTLAAQLALAFGNLVLYDDIQRHAAQLEIEIAERKEHQKKIARLTRLYAVLSGINSAIVRTHDRDALFNEACRVAVEHGEFGIVWIGLVDKDSESLRHVASYGVDKGLIQAVVRSQQTNLYTDHGTASESLRSKRPAWCNDIRVAAEAGLLREEASRRGYRSVISLPLFAGDAALGVMVLYAMEAGFFDDQEVKLLEELAGDISFGLQYIEKEERLDYLAYYDALTGLPNSTLFRDRLNQFISSINDAPGMVTLMLIDLDHFTHLNNTLGRHAGDMLLKSVAERLRGVLREPYSLARIGADTFAIALADRRSGADDALSLLQQHVFAPFQRSFVVDGNEIRLSARAGIALYPADAADAETLFKNAEAALKHAQSSDETCLYYQPAMTARIAERLALEDELRNAVECQQFVLHYQPKVDLSSGRITGVEALIRWQHPEMGIRSPAQFIPVAEDSGLIIAIGEWVLRAACVQNQAWQDAHLPPISISVNVSVRELKQQGFVQTVARVLAQTGLQPRYLELELTETLLMQDAEGFIARLNALKALGVKLSVDDFGTGYSSLNYLKRFPIDELKVDQSFVRDVATNSNDTAIVRAVISLGHSLQLDVTAEGVETEVQVAWLRRHRCEQIQGYYFSHGVPAEEFEQMLRERKSLPPPASGKAESRTLLILDDEVDVTTSLTRLLRRDDYRILAAQTAAQAFELLALNDVQVIISDQRMPLMTGTEFLAKVKNLYPDTVRILCSGYTEVQALTEAVNRGAIYRFLAKPWDDEEMRQSVREAFHHHWLTHTEAKLKQLRRLA